MHGTTPPAHTPAVCPLTAIVVAGEARWTVLPDSRFAFWWLCSALTALSYFVVSSCFLLAFYLPPQAELAAAVPAHRLTTSPWLIVVLVLDSFADLFCVCDVYLRLLHWVPVALWTARHAQAASHSAHGNSPKHRLGGAAAPSRATESRRRSTNAGTPRSSTATNVAKGYGSWLVDYVVLTACVLQAHCQDILPWMAGGGFGDITSL